MAFFYYCLVSIAMLLITCSCDVKYKLNKFLKLHSLTDLTSDQYHQIFATTYQDESKKTAKHNIHLFDDFGKYIKLSYHSKHPLDVNILKLDEELHTNNIISLQCTSDINQNNIIKLNFKSKFVTKQYYNDIKLSISHSQKKHFIAADDRWRCTHSKSILNQITQIQLNDTQLILYTEQASIIDVFQELSISYETNMNHNPYKTVYIPEIPPQRRRLADNFWGTLWSDAIHGLSAIVSFIKGIIHDMNVPAVTAYIEGESLQFGPKNANKSWNWNYDENGKSDPIQILKNVTCDNCYAHVNAAYTYQLNIADRKVQYLLISLEGNTEIGAGIAVKGVSVKGNTSLKQEYRKNTPQIPIFEFSVAGISFSAKLYGAIGIGVYGDVTDFSYDIASSGYIKKGIEYNRSSNHKYNYINQHSLHFEHNAPQLSLEQGEMSAYIRSTLYLQLSSIGSFFFGLQPTFDFKMTLGDNPDCLVNYEPSTKTNDFIGANLSIIDWYKKIDFAAHQTNLDNWSGCIDKSQIIHNQAWNEILDIFSDGTERRRLITNVTDHIPNLKQTKTYIDYTDIHPMPSFSMDSDEQLSHHWGNLSTIPSLCDDYNEICNGYITQAIVPRVGRLFMSLENGTLLGLYRTLIEIAPSNGWVFLNTSMITNVSCTARHQFDVIPVAHVYGIGYVWTYKVTLLEWYCDADIEMFGINETLNPRHYAGWECMISLPSEMSAIASDVSFGSVMLFDAPNWCHVFALSRKQHYVLDEPEINWNTFEYPLWYGVWDCMCSVLNVTEQESELYFVSYNDDTRETDVIIQWDGVTMYLKGYMDVVHMEMQLDAIYWYEKKMFFDDMDHQLQLFGLLRILSDGSIIYAGSVKHKECTGFLFYGYLDFAQLDITNNIAISSQEIDAKDSFLSTKSIVMFFIGMASCSVIVMFVWMCLRYRNKKRSSELELMHNLL